MPTKTQVCLPQVLEINELYKLIAYNVCVTNLLKIAVQTMGLD